MTPLIRRTRNWSWDSREVSLFPLLAFDCVLSQTYPVTVSRMTFWILWVLQGKHCTKVTLGTCQIGILYYRNSNGLEIFLINFCLCVPHSLSTTKHTRKQANHSPLTHAQKCCWISWMVFFDAFLHAPSTEMLASFLCKIFFSPILVNLKLIYKVFH